MYKDTPEFRLFLYRQYSWQYGELASTGAYQIGDGVRFDNTQAKGTIAWKYQDQERGLIYVLEDYSGFLFELTAKEIISKI